MVELCQSFMVRCQTILTKEDIKYDDKVLAELIMKFAPDWRRVLNELQRYSVNGTIDSGVLNIVSDKNYDELCNHCNWNYSWKNYYFIIIRLRICLF